MTQAGVDTPVKINCDANIFVVEFTKQEPLPLELAPGRQAYVQCVEGGMVLSAAGDEVKLKQHDACEVHQAGTLMVTQPCA